MKPYPMKYCIAGAQEDDDGGAFEVPFEGRRLNVIASHGGGWDHVSVSLSTRNPNWREMCFIKDLFFKPEECAIQFHPPKQNYVNIHNFCLHLWRPHNIELQMPPMEYV